MFNRRNTTAALLTIVGQFSRVIGADDEPRHLTFHSQENSSEKAEETEQIKIIVATLIGCGIALCGVAVYLCCCHPSPQEKQDNTQYKRVPTQETTIGVNSESDDENEEESSQKQKFCC